MQSNLLNSLLASYSLHVTYIGHSLIFDIWKKTAGRSMLLMLMINMSRNHDVLQFACLNDANATESSEGHECPHGFSIEDPDDLNCLGEVFEAVPAIFNSSFLHPDYRGFHICSLATSVWQPPENLL